MKTSSFHLFASMSLLSVLLGGLAGCGGDSGTNISVVSSAASKECIGCHASNSRSVSSTSGVMITAEWQLSAHNTANGAGCLDCHSNAHYHDNNMTCRNCHATAHTNKGTLCSDCHGGSSPNLADCRSCHTSVHKDPSSCTRCHGGSIPVDVAMKNPDFAGKCFGCHQNSQHFKNHSVAARHFNNLTDSGKPQAMYVTANNQNACTSCHEPHNPLKGLGNKERKAWAASGHGDVTKPAWSEDPFATMATCNACHTPTGFVKALGNGWTDTTAVNTGMQPLTCNACHRSSNFKNSVRTLSGGYRAGMGGFGANAKASIQYPDVGESNLCVPCHASRENGASLVAAVTNFSNASFKNPHYLAAAAVFYGKGGFKFYTSAIRYQTQYGVVADGVIIPATAASSSNSTPAIAIGDVMEGEKANWSHGKLGMNNFQSSKNAAVVAAKGNLVFTGTGGQCVTCHMGSGAKPGLHSFGAFDVAKATWASTYKGCYGCHTNEDIEEVADLDEKPKYDRAMAFFQWQLAQLGLFYTDSAHPYFYTAPYDATYSETGACAKNLPVKNWQAGGTSTFTWNAAKKSCDSAAATAGTVGTGPGIMGAAMNFKLLKAEKGAHVHNRTFMKQMIFDSIQYLQKGAVTYSNRNIVSGSTTINALINFSSYSAAVTPAGGGLPNDLAGNIKSISELKGYIVRKNTSGATGGTTSVPVYTRN